LHMSAYARALGQYHRQIDMDRQTQRMTSNSHEIQKSTKNYLQIHNILLTCQQTEQ
jgi:hypothetical protein